ncbi:MAG TPA: alkaline phosphatase D family protein [Steroidobacteraceae bacterium]|nr:alkaline phosphatase D family protein [Steroidobacteraceae bacterium]
MTQLNRRELIAALAALGLAPAALAREDEPSFTFAHGVASGDPQRDRVILWTRVTPVDPTETLRVRWSIASDPGMKQIRQSGRFVTDQRRGFTVKVDAAGLEPGLTYYYQFEARGVKSPIGRTRTLPAGRVDRLRLAFASCSNYPHGYFNAYARIAERDDLDFVLHLGDYIYEYKLGEYADPQLAGQRDVVPKHEIVTLDDYRLRYALYRSDPDLQEVHRQHPFITVWDDHESANNSWRDGAENHDPDQGEGEWQTRRRNAVQAYNEFMPIRSSSLSDDSIYQAFQFGDLADILMLDTRLHGRDKQVDLKAGESDIAASDPAIADPKRTLLGFDQEKWLAGELRKSKDRKQPWRILGQQVMMAQLSRTQGSTIRNPDQWDGYAPTRERLFQVLRERDIRNNVVLTGDIHSSWCNELKSNPWAASATSSEARIVGVEFVGPAVSSPGLRDRAQAVTDAERVRSTSPHMKYVELHKRGYCVLDVTRDRAQCEYYHLATVSTRDKQQELATVYASEAGSNALKPGTAETRSALAEPAPK